MKLATKISLSMGLLAVLMTALAAFNLVQMRNVNNMSTVIADQRIPIIVAADAMNNAQSEARMAEVKHIYAEKTEEMQAQEKAMQKWAQVITANLAVLEERLGSNNPLIAEFKAARISYKTLRDTVLALSKELKTEEALAILNGESENAYQDLSMVLGEMVERAVSNASDASAQGNALYESSVRLSAILLLVAVLIAVGLTAFVVRNTLKQLGKDPGLLAIIAQRVTDGDYDIDDGSPKIGVYGNIVSMVEALKTHIDNAQRESDNARAESARAQEAMKQADAASAEARAKTESMLQAADRLEQVAQIVSSASTELSAQIEQSDRGAAESAARLSEAATAMNEMNATVLEVAKNAGAAADVSTGTRQEAEQGAHIVEQSVASIQAVQKQAIALKEDMVKLDESAKAINQIMGVISDIADQTNLLALNAAIEAARAGDAGRGFAVVADSVRTLAEKTMASTTDVGNAIKAIQDSTAQSMAAMDNAVRLVEEATGYSVQSGEALKSIVSKVDETVDQVRAIAAASEEQSAASEEINQSIVQVNETASQTAQAMAEAAKAVSDLAQQAQELTVLIGDMKKG